jgi:hypothetical protein
MTARPANVPANAEQHDLIPCLVMVDAPSKFLPGHTQKIFKFHCAGCAAEQPEPRSDVPLTCSQCGLHMMKSGGLTLWVWPADSRVLSPVLQETD